MQQTPVSMSRHRTAQFRRALIDYHLAPSDDAVLRAHAFDSSVRSLAMALTEQVEIALRGRLDVAVEARVGVRWYLSPSTFAADFDHAAFLAVARRVLDRSLEPAVRSAWQGGRFERIPFGMLAEELSFGDLVRLASGVGPTPRAEIAAGFHLPTSTLRSTLLHVNHVRNCCAHHVRLWGRRLRVPPPTFRSPPELPRRLDGLPKRSPAHSIELLAYLAETTGPCERHTAALRRLLDEHDDLVDGLGGRPTWARA